MFPGHQARPRASQAAARIHARWRRRRARRGAERRRCAESHDRAGAAASVSTNFNKAADEDRQQEERIPMKIEYSRVRDLRPYPNNARTHSKKQVRQIARSIKKFGFCNPVLIDDGKQIIAGHGRVEAAKLLGIDAVPTCRLSHLSEADKRAYILADNKLAEKAGWDKQLLAIELQYLITRTAMMVAMPVSFSQRQQLICSL